MSTKFVMSLSDILSSTVLLKCSGMQYSRANWVYICFCDRALMEKDVTLPPETFRKHMDLCLTHINCVLKKMSRLFLVEDLVDSLKVSVGSC